MNIKTFSLFALVLLQSISSLAKVSQDQANKLGAELTPMGGEMKANKDGSIPRYSGGLDQDLNSDQFNDIYKIERPLFVITAKNISKYQDKLSEGQKALFRTFPDTYTMPVYKTHRNASAPQAIYQKVRANASKTQLVNGGNGLVNFDESVPFAIPKTGVEIIWNHISRYRGGTIEINSAQLSVQRNGSFQAIKTRARSTTPYYLKGGFDEEKDTNILFYFMQRVKSPARYTGNTLLIHETIDQVKQPRMAWSYNAGQRRVRRAPQVAYDAPLRASGGLRTSDQVDMFNGSPDRYDWKLVSKKEIYIPYNSYKLADKNVKYTDIIGAGHINQNYTRYELHRVWQVEATLKEGARHIYAKRTFYIDEDSWQIALADHYDNRGELWRVSEGHGMQFVNVDSFLFSSVTSYDLISGRYFIELSNEEKSPFKFNKEMKRKEFTSAALRRQGKR